MSTPPQEMIATTENSAVAPGQQPEGMVWIPAASSRWARSMPGMNDVGMQATRDSRPIHRVLRGWLLDGRDRSHQRAVRAVRRSDRLCDGRRAQAAAEDFPGAPPENLVAGSVVFTPPDACSTAQRSFPVVGVRARCELAASARAGRARSRARISIPSCTSPTRMRWRTRSGPASGCRPKPNGSSPLAAGSAGKLYPWGNEFMPGATVDGEQSPGSLPGQRHRRRWLRRHRAGGAVPAERLRAVRRRPATSGSGSATGIAPTTTRSSRPRAQSRATRKGRTRRSIPSEPDAAEARAPRRLVPVHRSVLLALHGRHAGQGRSQHGHESRRLPLREGAREIVATTSSGGGCR